MFAVVVDFFVLSGRRWDLLRAGARPTLDALPLGRRQTGIEVSAAELAAVPLSRHDFHGDWNYSIAQTKSR
jgi:hypothetical protein